MSTLGELLRAMPLASGNAGSPADQAGTRIRGRASSGVVPAFSVRDEQIQALAHRLFFDHEAGPVRNAAFCPVEASAQTAPMCLDVAKALAAGGKYDIGLIDASASGLPLQQQLQISTPAHSKPTWPISSRLWLVPRESWGQEPEAVSDEDLDRLRDLMMDFDFSVLYCSPASWLTVRIAQRCDGLVLILTANKTRRLAAAQIKEQLTRAHIPLLGTVLAERRLPVPQGLYTRL